MADREDPQFSSASRLTAPGAPLAPFRVPAFRAIWFANLASNLGSTIQSVAAAWLMTDLTTSHRLIALVQASATIPIMLLGLFAGAIADNFDRRRVMLAAQVGMLVVSAVLSVLTWYGAITPLLLLTMTLLVGTGTALNSPAWQASVRQQVGRDDLPQAISLNSVAFNLARSVGPALGGVILSIFNTAVAFAINAVSFIGMVVVLLRWHPVAEQPRQRQPMLSAIATGVRHCAGSSPIRRLLLRGFTLGFGVAAYNGLLPAIARTQLGAGEIGFGLVLGAFGVGSIIAALFVTSLRRRFGFELLSTAATVGFAVAQFSLALAHGLIAALPAAFLAGTAWVFTLTSMNIAMQLMSPDAILGRCLSIYQAVTFGGMALGAWAWGTVADWRDLPFALHSAGAWLVVTLIVLRVVAPVPWPDPPVRKLRTAR